MKIAMKIAVTQKAPNEYVACHASNAQIWGRGNSVSEAIGDMIQSHARFLDVTVEVNDFVFTPSMQKGFLTAPIANNRRRAQAALKEASK